MHPTSAATSLVAGQPLSTRVDFPGAEQLLAGLGRAKCEPLDGKGNAMPKESAGLLMYRVKNGELEFLLAHPGGPLWKNKDAGAWTIPKGELRPGEDPLTAARREFEEELGFKPQGDFIALPSITQKSGKLVHAWAFAGDCDPSQIRSNTFTMEWPPRSGRVSAFPEVDQAAFFTLDQARQKLNPAQIPLLEALAHLHRTAGVRAKQ